MRREVETRQLALAVLLGRNERRLPDYSGLRHGITVVISRFELDRMTIGIGEEVKWAVLLTAA